MTTLVLEHIEITKESQPLQECPTIEELYTTYYGLVFHRIYSIIHHQQQAEDLTHDTFLKALQALLKIDASLNIRSWLSTIATNSAIDAHRRARRAGYCSLGEDDYERPDLTACNLQEDCTTRNLVEQVLMHLPEHERRALRLYYLHDYSVRMVAEREKVTPACIRTRLHRGRRTFHDYFKRYAKEGF